MASSKTPKGSNFSEVQSIEERSSRVPGRIRCMWIRDQVITCWKRENEHQNVSKDGRSFPINNHKPLFHTLLILLALASLFRWQLPQTSEDPSLVEDTFLVYHDKEFSKGQKKLQANCEEIKRSSLYDTGCGAIGSPPKPLSLLITGAGRSGTQYLSKVLSIVGIDVSHDTGKPRRHGAVSWPLAFSHAILDATTEEKERTCSHPWGWGSKARYEKVVHVVRHPLSSISSRFNNGRKQPQYTVHDYSSCHTDLRKNFNKTLPSRRKKLALAIRHWVLWNTFVEKTSTWGFRIEDFTNQPEDHITHLSNLTGLWADSNKFSRVRSVSTLLNSKHTSKKHGYLLWPRLLHADEEFATMAQVLALRYGYRIRTSQLSPRLRAAYCSPPKQGHCTISHRPRLECSFDSTARWTCSLPKHI